MTQPPLSRNVVSRFRQVGPNMTAQLSWALSEVVMILFSHHCHSGSIPRCLSVGLLWEGPEMSAGSGSSLSSLSTKWWIISVPMSPEEFRYPNEGWLGSRSSQTQFPLTGSSLNIFFIYFFFTVFIQKKNDKVCDKVVSAAFFFFFKEIRQTAVDRFSPLV